ncbi:hypothetical protein DERF_012725 [Dermatophagoides farinae]|uniref:Uncharacterized protein n=1 Tax=Dermatophagoides farinae TaxID=6954 RepID=A0A922L0K5_DERFA|nr:hypothetical protein DERF_012725 [Dermatophagoides farinae]
MKLSKKYGIMRSSEFFKLNCNLFKLALPDLFHDIQEGILTDVTKSILIWLKEEDQIHQVGQLTRAELPNNGKGGDSKI